MTEDFENGEHPETHEPTTCKECIRQETLGKAEVLLENASSIVNAFSTLVSEMERLEQKAFEEIPEELRNLSQTPYLTRYMRTIGMYNTLIKSVSLFSPDDTQVIAHARVLEARSKQDSFMGEFLEESEEPPKPRKVNKNLN